MRNLKVASFKDANGVATGIIKPSTTKPEWGSVMVIEESKSLVKGLLVSSKRVGFLRAKLVDIAALQLTEGCNLNAALAKSGLPAHKIAVIETTEPQYEGHQPKINPTDKSVMVSANGSAIYYNTVLVTEDVADVKIASGATANVAAEVEVLTK